MAQKVLILGESGTGKSTSLRNCIPEELAVVNPVGKPLPFKGKFEMLNGETDSRKIIKWIKEQVNTGKKMIVIDDFQYILAVPYMHRIKESNWDKFNDFGANYFDLIEMCDDLPDDVIVFYMSHLETLDTGLTTVKLIGKLLREKITIEGLFTIVLRTGTHEAKYYFYTQNSGKDTVKSPMGMFPSYAIDNDLKYVDDKIRNYYEIGEYKQDEEIAKADKEAAADVLKPDASGRRVRGAKGAKNDDAPKERKSRTREEVHADNQEKLGEYLDKCDDAIADSGAGDGVPFNEAEKTTEDIPKPGPEKLPRKRKPRGESGVNYDEEVDAEDLAGDDKEPEMEQTKTEETRTRRARRTR